MNFMRERGRLMVKCSEFLGYLRSASILRTRDRPYFAKFAHFTEIYLTLNVQNLRQKLIQWFNHHQIRFQCGFRRGAIHRFVFNQNQNGRAPLQDKFMVELKVTCLFLCRLFKCLNMNIKLRIHWRANDKLEIISEIYSVIDEAL